MRSQRVVVSIPLNVLLVPFLRIVDGKDHVDHGCCVVRGVSGGGGGGSSMYFVHCCLCKHTGAVGKCHASGWKGSVKEISEPLFEHWGGSRWCVGVESVVINSAQLFFPFFF